MSTTQCESLVAALIEAWDPFQPLGAMDRDITMHYRGFDNANCGWLMPLSSVTEQIDSYLDAA